MKRQYYKRTDLVCLECGYVFSINRIYGHQKKLGHIKDLYCPCCQYTTKFYEVKDIDIFKYICENSDFLNSEQIEIMNLLKKREVEDEQSELGIHKKVFKKR